MRRVPLAAVPLAFAGCTGGSESDRAPCELGIAVTADGEAHTTLPAAVERALQLDGVVDVCPGTHEVEGRLDDTPASTSPTPVLIRGTGRDTTQLVGTGEGVFGGNHKRPVTITDLAIADSVAEWASDECSAPGESDVECDDPFNHDDQPEGALQAWGSWEFRRVRISDNSGYWGGAVTIPQPPEGISSTVLFIDSEILRNSAVDDTRGGAVLVDYNDDWGPRGELTITSINTDWGEGGDDNAPDDIAFASWDGYFHDSLVVHASYRFDGVADFTCDALAYTCE